MTDYQMVASTPLTVLLRIVEIPLNLRFSYTAVHRTKDNLSCASGITLWTLDRKSSLQRIKKTEDPKLAFDRRMETYLLKAYSKEWINLRSVSD